MPWGFRRRPEKQQWTPFSVIGGGVCGGGMGGSHCVKSESEKWG